MKQAVFYFVIVIALVGLITNLDVFLFSILKTIITLAILGGIAYLVYYFFFLTEDQRKYKKALRKHRKQHRR